MLYIVSQVLAQKPGALKKESHPKLSVAACTTKGGCTDQQKMVTIDSNWRWTHEDGVAKNCYTGNKWDDTLCPANDPDTCTKNCVIEGADAEYESTYGVTAQGADLRLNFVTQGPSSKNIGSRTYLMNVRCPARWLAGHALRGLPPPSPPLAHLPRRPLCTPVLAARPVPPSH